MQCTKLDVILQRLSKVVALAREHMGVLGMAVKDEDALHCSDWCDRVR